MTGPALKRTFVVELDDETSAVMKVLEAFALGGARLTGLDLRAAEADGLRLKVMAVDLDELRADRIGRRVAGLTVVRQMASGWMTG
jgi:hypothetical protein